MGKKDLDIDGYFGNDNKNKKNNTSNIDNVDNIDNIDNTSKPIRVTFILDAQIKQKIDEIAYFQRKQKSELVQEILSNYVEKHHTKTVREVWNNKL